MCTGTKNGRWSAEAGRCVAGGPSQFCDSVTQSTCTVARWNAELIEIEEYTVQDLLDANALPTAEMRWDAGADENHAMVEYVGPEWYQAGLRGGDRLHSINGDPVTEDNLAELYTLTDIAAVVLHDGNLISLTLP